MLGMLADRLHQTGLRNTVRLMGTAAYYVATNLRQCAIRRCRCCQRTSLFLPVHRGDEAIRCLRCGANRRMEMLAEVLRARTGGQLASLDVLELDSNSCLRSLLAGSRTYVRSFYSATRPLGSEDRDGARCEDITRLTFADASFDIIVSSDVLEHVPDLDAAFRESFRVLRPGGAHVFTVPVAEATAQRAVREGDAVVHLLPPCVPSRPARPERHPGLLGSRARPGATLRRLRPGLRHCGRPRRAGRPHRVHRDEAWLNVERLRNLANRQWRILAAGLPATFRS